MTKEEYEEYGRKLKESPRVGKTQMVMDQLLNWLSYSDNPTEFKPLVFEMVLKEI